MNKIKTFFYVLKNSVISPKYYNDILKTNFKFSIKYFVVLSFFSSLIFATIVSIKIAPEAKNAAISAIDNFREIYPEDFEVIFSEGNWRINQEEPYFIKNPMKLSEVSSQGEGLYFGEQDNVIVFDKNGTINDLDEYNTLFIVNETNLIFKDRETGEVMSQPTTSVPDFTLDKNIIDERTETLYIYARAIPYFLPVLLFVFDFTINYLVGGFVHIILASLIIYILSLLLGKKLNFQSACKIIIHTMTIPIILRLFIRLMEVDVIIMGWFLMLNIFIAFVFMVNMEGSWDLKKIEKPKEIS